MFGALATPCCAPSSQVHPTTPSDPSSVREGVLLAPSPRTKHEEVDNRDAPSRERENSTRHTPAPAPGLVTLEVPGHGAAIVSVPTLTRTLRPVLLAAHGAGDNPTWQCEVWRSIIRDRGFVVCPQGTKMSWGLAGEDLGFFYRDHLALEKEVLAVLDSFHDRFGAWVAPGSVVFAGYSQGGSMGALMLVKHPQTFQRVILVEGGEAEWDVPTAIKFRRGGGKRVLFVCGRHACNERARRSVGWLRRGQVEVRHEFVQGGGHTYGGTVARRLVDTFDWVVDGDPRWHMIPP